MTHRALADVTARQKVTAKVEKLRTRAARFVQRQREAGVDV